MKKILLIILNLISIVSFSYITKDIEIYSNTMKKHIPITITLPDNYNNNTKYNVVYTLHGWSGNNKNFIEKLNVGKYSDKYNIITISPDGNFDSWWLDSEIKKESQYETFIIKELVKYIDDNFSTYKNFKNRAITGLSMGGFGSLHLAINNPKTFGIVGSMSGGFDIERFKLNWGIENVIEIQKFNEFNIVPRATKLIFSGTKLIFDCGINDFFIEANRKLHNELISLNIPHDYIERDGSHSWVYWNNSLEYQMLFFNNNFIK